MAAFEITDENGNIHGPFETKEQALKCASDRALGEMRDCDDESGRGWTLQATQTASIRS